MDLQEAVNYAKRGHSVVFLGSGFSLGATNQLGAPIPSSNDLNGMLAKELGIGIDTDLQVTSELFQEERGETELRRLLVDTFSVTKVTQWQKTIISAPWRRLYTTNYDDVCEVAASQETSKLISATINDPPDKLPSAAKVLVHLHGSVRSFTRNEGASGTFQLTSSSYFSSVFPRSPWSPAIRNDFTFARSTFFVGYSLNDFDIARLIFDDEEIKGKTFIICKSGTSDVEKRRLAKFGHVLAIGIDEFAQALAHADLSQTVVSPHNPISFREILAPSAPTPPSQDYYVELLTSGAFRPDVYAFAKSTQNQHYATPRRALADLKTNENARRIVVHSGLGNGKSLFLQLLAQDYIARGIRVFEFFRRSDNFHVEISQILQQGDRVCLLFDNLFAYKDIITYSHTHIGRDDLIVASSRTLQYELNTDDAGSVMGADFVEIDLNVLTRQELEYTSAAFTSYGLWGRQNYLPEHKKRAYLAENCNSEIRSIVLFAFASGPVSEKIKAGQTRLSGLTSRSRNSFFQALFSLLFTLK